MSSFLQLCQDVRAQAGISGEGPTNVVSQTGIYADVVRWVQEAYTDIQSLYENWNFLYTEMSFTLQSGFNTYPIKSTYDLRVTTKDTMYVNVPGLDKTVVNYLPYAIWKQKVDVNSTKTGSPTYFTETPTGVTKFFPTPDQDLIISLEGYLNAQTMTASADLPLIPTQFHDLIKAKALVKYGEFYNEQGMYQTSMALYKERLAELKYSEIPRDSLLTPAFIPLA